MKRLILLLGLVLGLVSAKSTTAQSSSAVYLKFQGLSVHPVLGADNALYTRKLGSSGRYVMNIGVLAGGDLFFHKDIAGVRFSVGALSDCGGAFAGLVHLGTRFRVAKLNRFTMYTGIGPILYFREDWNRTLPGYTGKDTNFSIRGKWQYIFAWYGGEIELNYRLDPRTDFSVTTVPAYPDLISFAVGVKRWM